jgi:thiamine-phosphate pyrophosphorylase
MRFEFTPGAERALTAAAGWSSSVEFDDLHLPEVLLGLLFEPECRAALLLAAHGIDEAAVRERFPQLAPVAPAAADRAERFAPALRSALHAAESLLIEYPRPLTLATEHLLLGIAASENEVARWLDERGLKAAALEAEVHRLSGHQPGPLPLEPDDDLADWVDEGESVSIPESSGAEWAAASSEAERIGSLRILDAAANRAGEGLRVVEDYLRFVLDDRHLTSHCKAIRHDLTAVLSAFSSAERHAARETLADVGQDVSTAAERHRTHALAVVEANFKRVEQSLRSLEEFAKIADAATAHTLEQLRYRVYTLERATDITRHSLTRLDQARLYALVDGRSSLESLVRLVETLISAGVSVIQLRDKKLADRELLERARQVRERTRGTGTLFIMNDRPDLALLAGADGVHIGQDELTVKDARRIVGPTALIGVSTHSLEQARAAVLAGANYIGVGPTFASGTKQFAHFTGTQLLEAVQAEIRLPAFAIGGITSKNLPHVLAAGFTRVVVSGAITTAMDPGQAARELLAALAAK